MPTLQDGTFRQIAELMHASMGLSFADSKKPLVASRLGNRIQKLGLESYEEYLEIITDAGNGAEFQVAVNLLTTNETYFFREPSHFERLQDYVCSLPRRSISIWSAASSFGDEAYSIAMLLADLQERGSIGPDWSILGTDISERVLQAAAAGVFPEERLRDVSVERLRKYCLRGEGPSEGLVQVQEKLQRHVRFGWLNLCRPIEPLGPFDSIFLRNVLIYFDQQTKTEVVDRVLERLRPNGLLFIGTAEGRVPCRTPLTVLAPGVFRKASD